MTQKDKELLLKDLSARLPYGVVCNIGLDHPLPLQRLFVDKLDGILLDFYENGQDHQVYLSEVKSYLRPLSSMTEEEKKELLQIRPYMVFKDDTVKSASCNTFYQMADVLDWLNKKMFDYRTDDEGKTMIEKGLALEAPKEMYNLK